MVAYRSLQHMNEASPGSQPDRKGHDCHPYHTAEDLLLVNDKALDLTA